MKSVLTLGILLTGKDMLSPVLGRTERRLGKIEAKAKSIGKVMTAYATGAVAGSMAVGNAIKSTVLSYNELGKAQGEIRSLGISADGISLISKEAQKFSSKFAGTTAPEFVRASYSIKSGISSLSNAGVAEFTRLSALTAKATLSTTGQMTSLFATGYGIYRKQFEAFGEKNIKGWKKLSKEARDIKFAEHFSAGIAGAVQAFKTNGSQMQSAIEALGATATTSNVPLKEQLAILGLLQKTKSGSESATMYRAFLTSAGGAAKKLKLDFLDSNNQLKSTPKILEQLRKKYGETLDDIEKQELKKAFGTDEAMAFITMFYDGTEELNKSIDLMSSKMRSGTKEVLSMAEAINQGREFELLSQRTENLSIAIGRQFAPAAIWLSKAIGKVTTSITKWTEENPELSKTVAQFVSGATLLIGTLGTLTIGLKTASLAMKLFGSRGTKNKQVINQTIGAVEKLKWSTKKPVNLKMSMNLPSKKTMNSKIGSIIGEMTRYAKANPIKLVATVAVLSAVVAGAKAIGEAQHKHIKMGRGATFSKEQLREQIAYKKAELKAMNESWTLDKAKDLFMHGSATAARKKQVEGQIRQAERRLEKLEKQKKESSVLKKVKSTSKNSTTSSTTVNAPITINVKQISDKQEVDSLAKEVAKELNRARSKAIKFEDED